MPCQAAPALWKPSAAVAAKKAEAATERQLAACPLGRQAPAAARAFGAWPPLSAAKSICGLWLPGTNMPSSTRAGLTTGAAAQSSEGSFRLGNWLSRLVVWSAAW